jgi:hypothetical protein
MISLIVGFFLKKKYVGFLNVSFYIKKFQV